MHTHRTENGYFLTFNVAYKNEYNKTCSNKTMLFQAEQPIVRLPDGKFQAVEQKNVAGSEHWWHTWR